MNWHKLFESHLSALGSHDTRRLSAPVLVAPLAAAAALFATELHASTSWAHNLPVGHPILFQESSMSNYRILASVALAAAASLSLFSVQAQNSSTGNANAGGSAHENGNATRNSSQTTSPGLPPGAESTTGNKAAVPASGGMDKNPNTGSTPGTIPAARSPQGNKADTPKSGNSNSDSGSTGTMSR